MRHGFSRSPKRQLPSFWLRQNDDLTGDVDVVGWEAGVVAGVHGGVGGFEVAGEAVGVEQGCGEAIAFEFFAQVLEACGVVGEFDGEALVIGGRGGDELGKIDCAEQAGSHAAGEGFSDAGQHGQTGP